MPAHKIPLEVRFWAKVEKSDGCWLWTGAKSGDGYGHIKVDGRMVKAHRVSYELGGRAIPEGFDLDHLCRTPLCVSPDHLEAVERRENVARGSSPGANSQRTNKCGRGHEFTDENTYAYRTSRVCRACRRDYYAQRRAASR